jgi:hypothetical protein
MAPSKTFTYAMPVTVGMVALLLSSVTLSGVSSAATTTPYSLSAAWTYYLEAVRDESWPSCDYRFLSYVDNASSTVANLWKDAGVNQQFIVNPRGNGRLTISALHGGTRLLTVGAGCADDVVQLTDDDGAVVWEALPASDQPGHYFLRSVDRAGCSAEFLGFASTCDDQAPNGLKMVGQNGSSWRFFAAAPTTKVEHHAATPEPCADPFAWYAEDVQEYRLVCTGKTLPLYSAAHLGPNTTFTKLGGALGKQGYPAWLKRPARWAPENMMLTRPATPSSLGHIAAAADIGLNSRFGETAAAAADDGRVNFMVVCDKQADGAHRIGYVVSRGGPRDHAWNEYSPTYLNLSAPEAGQIDPHLFRDPVSNATFLLYKSQDNRIHKPTTRLWIQRVHLDATNGTLEQLDESRVILNSTGLWWAPGFEGPKSTLVEGPEMMYYDGYYYLFFAGGKYCDDQYTEGVARSLSPLGPFEKMMVPLLSAGMLGYTDGSKLQGPGHGSLVTSPTTGQFYLVFHAHQQAKQCVRHAYIVEFQFVNGWPVMVFGSVNEARGDSVSAPSKGVQHFYDRV